MKRYVRFATAVYGENMMRSSEMDRTGSFNLSSSSSSSLSIFEQLFVSPDNTSTDNTKNIDSSLSSKSIRIRQRICDYCNITNINDIIHMDIDFDSINYKLLRHFIALDHQHKQIIFSIRGTFSLGEIFVDVAAFTSKLICIVHIYMYLLEHTFYHMNQKGCMIQTNLDLSSSFLYEKILIITKDHSAMVKHMQKCHLWRNVYGMLMKKLY